MSNETRDSGHKVSSNAQSNAHFIWHLSKRPVPDEMNTSFGLRIDADRWGFHDGIDLPLIYYFSCEAGVEGQVAHPDKENVKTRLKPGYGVRLCKLHLSN